MRVVAVTGAASGIGRAVTTSCHDRGDRVITIDRADADVNTDLSTSRGRQAAIAAIGALTGGPLGAVVAWAGLAFADPAPLLAVNFFGATELVAGLRTHLAASEAPRAVVISSEALVLGQDAATVAACLAGDEPAAIQAARAAPEKAYFSSKRALSLWVKREAVTPAWAGAGILLNAVAPGVVRTPMIRSLLATAEGLAALEQSTPTRLGRPAEAEEIARLVCFLISAENSFMVGQTLFCDGGAEATLRPDHV